MDVDTCETIEQIIEFLTTVDKDFPVPLSQKQSLGLYAQKLLQKATICAEISDGKILSMVAGYTDNVEQNIGYISIVATVSAYRGNGLAARLVRQFLSIAEEKRLSAVHLYAVKSNVRAVRMYKQIGFIEYICENEARPDDLHLIYYL